MTYNSGWRSRAGSEQASHLNQEIGELCSPSSDIGALYRGDASSDCYLVPQNGNISARSTSRPQKGFFPHEPLLSIFTVDGNVCHLCGKIRGSCLAFEFRSPGPKALIPAVQNELKCRPPFVWIAGVQKPPIPVLREEIASNASPQPGNLLCNPSPCDGGAVHPEIEVALRKAG